MKFNIQKFGTTNLDILEVDSIVVSGEGSFGTVSFSNIDAIVTADVVAASGSAPTKTEYDTVVALVNELKAKVNEFCKG